MADGVNGGQGPRAQPVKERGRSRRAGAVLALAIFVGLAGAVVGKAVRAAGDGRALSYRPDAAAARPLGDTAVVEDGLAVRDFDGDGERLYLLDPLAPAVRVLRRDGTGWRTSGSFGRRGGGPGEFSMPTGLALLRDGRIAVAEPGRIHFFTREGAYLESAAPKLPCAMALPQVAGARRGIFVHGSCLRAGQPADTMQAVLFWSADGDQFELVTADPRFTTDGRFGSGYGPKVGFTDGEGHHLFGAGSTPCVYRITQADHAPAGERICDDEWKPYRLELSEKTRAALAAQRRRNPAAAGALRVPANHSPYVERVVLPSGDAWLQGFSEDSVVLRLIGDRADIAVLPYHGLVGCRRSGCLYAASAAAGVRIRFFPMTVLDSLSRKGLHPGPADGAVSEARR